MPDYTTPPLSEEGSEEVLREQNTREPETRQRLEMLERVRNAARQIGRQGSQGAFGVHRPRSR